MDEVKPTPGPWRIVRSENVNSVRIFAGDEYIATVGASDQSMEQIMVNARLIADAPVFNELLENGGESSF